MFENVERIEAPSREVFMRDYVLRQKPVILTNLFEGQPIRQIRNADIARQELGSTEVLLQMGHEERNRKAVLSLLTGKYDPTSIETERSSLGAFLDHLIAEPETKKVVAETPRKHTPKLNSLYDIPDYCKTATGTLDPDFSGELWLGRAGNSSLLHFDRDAKNLMQYQFFGEKHVILVPPTSGMKLIPIRNTCLVTPVNVSDAERDRFVRYVDGYQCVVRTGEALFFPALCWHYFDYNQMSMALTMRFHRNAAIKFLADNFHTDFHLQTLMYGLQDWNGTDETYRKAFREIEATWRAPNSNAVDKGEKLQALFEDLYRRVCSTAFQGDYSRNFFDLLRDAARKMEVQQGGFYASEQAA